MGLFLSAATSDWLHVLIACVVVVLFFAFAAFVFVRGLMLIGMLSGTLGKLKRVGTPAPGEIKTRLGEIFKGRRLAALWEEYEETLHEQFLETGTERRLASVRSTAAAQSFFNGETIVDDWLHIEFFKHLPGIFTGLGIIATFSGLITGLQSFDVTATDPAALKSSLGGLFSHVWSAFLLSAVAISLAMICTIVEKIVYAANLHKVAEIAAKLDNFFRSGVGEEYLSRLVRSSEEGTTQTKQLKESLVDDLKSLLTNLTERQIEATRQLSVDIGSNLQSSLQEPLQKIADTVHVASRNQGESASRMIENLMTAFMAQMRDTMGGQMGELGGLMRQSAESIARVETGLRAFVDDMQQASRSSTADLQATMTGLMSSLEEHGKQQHDAANAAQTQLLAQIQSATERMAQAQQENARQVDEAAAAATDRIAAATTAARQASEESARRANELAQDVQKTALDAIGGLEAGASRIAAMLASLDGAVERLSVSGTSLADLHERAGRLGGQLEGAAGALRQSAEAMGVSTQALGQAAVRVEGVAGLMASEAGARESAMKEVQLALSRSQEASRDFAQFSELVVEKLEEAIESFGSRTNHVLNSSLTDFDKELGNAVSMLDTLVQRMTVLAAGAEE